MLERIEDLAGGGKVELKWVAYRDYDMLASGRLIEASDWTSDSKTLLKFLDKIRCDGGGDFEEAVEVALAEANNDDPTRVLLIGDAPPHPEKAGNSLPHHRGHVLATDWMRECELLSRKGIPVFTFQVDFCFQSTRHYYVYEFTGPLLIK